MPPRKRPLTARTADKFVLYQEAVQGPEVDARFLSRHYQRTIGRPPRILREDFCGTGILACWFVHLHRENRAFGVDLHGPTLAWGRKHTVPRLPEDERPRVKLVRADVMQVSRPRADIIAALNFSYGIFKTRLTLGAYMRNSRRSLRKDGLLLLTHGAAATRSASAPTGSRTAGSSTSGTRSGSIRSTTTRSAGSTSSSPTGPVSATRSRTTGDCGRCRSSRS